MIAVISLNKKGDVIAEKIAENMPIDLYSKNEIKDFNINNITRDVMEKYEAVVFLASTGIAVRSIAPYIKSKEIDPAVIVIDVFGEYVISLLSGHLGGANVLSLKISELIGAIPVITTATDILKVKAPDIIAMENNLIIDNFKDAKEISALLLDERNVAFIDQENKIPVPEKYINLGDMAEAHEYIDEKNILNNTKHNFGSVEGNHNNTDVSTEGCSNNLDTAFKKKNIKFQSFNGIVYVTDKAKMYSLDKWSNLKKLKLVRKDIVLGIGCKKNYPPKIMIKQVCQKLEELNIDKRSVKYVATVEIKKDENAILALNQFLNSELRIFTKDDIREIQYKYEGSDFVEKSIGIRVVCEPCVELCGAQILGEKLSRFGMTLCVGKI